MIMYITYERFVQLLPFMAIYLVLMSPICPPDQEADHGNQYQMLMRKRIKFINEAMPGMR